MALSLSVWARLRFPIVSISWFRVITNVLPVAMYNGCGSVAFVYWLKLKQIVVPMKAQSHYGCDILGAIWDMGMLSSCICSTLVSVCAMKGIPIGPLTRWGKEFAYYLTPLLCLENWDMYHLGGACRGKDLPPGRILYIHTSQMSGSRDHTVLFLSDISQPNTIVYQSRRSRTFMKYCTIYRR